MIKKRVEKLKAKLVQLGLDGFLVMAPENRRYLSGFTGTAGILLITQKQNFLFTDFRYIEQAKEQATEYQVVKHGFPPLQTIKEVLARLPVKTLGFEGEFVTYKQYQELVEVFTNMELAAQNGLIEMLRLVKDENEIITISKAAAIADKAFEHLVKVIKPGMTELEAALELENFMRSQGASGTSFATIVASGSRSALPHGVASEKIIAKGELVTVDFGCIYQGYCSDMTRTLVLGEPSVKQREIYEIVLEAQLLGLENIKTGLGAKDVDKISRDYITKKGYGDYFGHGLGHGLGLAVHENPSLSPRDNTELKENMVVTIEPGIYLPQWGGVRIEDLVVVKKEGCLNLTHSPKELIII